MRTIERTNVFDEITNVSRQILRTEISRPSFPRSSSYGLRTDGFRGDIVITRWVILGRTSGVLLEA
jgi:hypothetical protein